MQGLSQGCEGKGLGECTWLEPLEGTAVGPVGARLTRPTRRPSALTRSHSAVPALADGAVACTVKAPSRRQRHAIRRELLLLRWQQGALREPGSDPTRRGKDGEEAMGWWAKPD